MGIFSRGPGFRVVQTRPNPTRDTAPDYHNYPYTFPTQPAVYLNCWVGNQLPGTGPFTGQRLFPIQVHADNQFTQKAGGYSTLHGMSGQAQARWITSVLAAKAALGG